MSFQCTVVTPEQQVLDETVTQAIVPVHDGQIGILTGRAPILVKLGSGALRVDLASGESRKWFVDGGIARMDGKKLTVLTDEATPAGEIDAETARAEYAEAQARIPTDDKTKRDRDRAMRRARAKQVLAGAR
jgi:F-type H+-transporting ATPase subunit epsilon